MFFVQTKFEMYIYMYKHNEQSNELQKINFFNVRRLTPLHTGDHEQFREERRGAPLPDHRDR